MTICKHVEWLHLAGGSEVSLINTGRLTKIAGELTNPTVQQPSIILFAGRKDKNDALRRLFPKHIKKERHDAIATLRIDNRTLYSDNPVLFADIDPFATFSPAPTPVSCHETQSFPLPWANATPARDVCDTLRAGILCQFSDVLCIFADDFPKFESVVDRLKTWAPAGGQKNLFEHVRPSVVIVKRSDGPSPSPTYDLLEMQEIQAGLDLEILKESYSSITVLHLADRQLSPLARYRRLKELLWRQMDIVRQRRRHYRCLYSAVHLGSFFQLAVSHTTASIRQPFSYIRASRQGNEIGPGYTDHIFSFLELGARLKVNFDTIAAFIASTILLDAYPPKMHRESLHHRYMITS